MNVCLDCGKDYHYDPSNPLGSSSLRCSACRKKNSKLNKKIKLFSIAGNDSIRCRKCGYSRCMNAIVLVDTTSFISPAKTEEEKEQRARRQYLLCLNCEAEIKSGEVTAEVINSKVYPVEVDFYEREVKVVKTKIKPSVEYSHDVVEAEITTSGPEAARTVGSPKRIDSGPTIDL